MAATRRNARCNRRADNPSIHRAAQRVNTRAPMMRVLKWTATIAAVAIGGVFAFRAVQAGRQRLKQAIGRAETIADQARATLEQTETTLRTVRDTI